MDDLAQDHRRVQAPTSSEEDDMCFIFLWFTLSMLVPGTLLSFGIMFVVEQNLGQMPHYSAAVDSVSRLDPVFGGGRNQPTLDLEFNLTHRVASHVFLDGQCADAGMRAEVSYHGVSLASSAATTEATCAGPMMAVDRTLVARGAGVAVPGSVLDSLAVDMRNGVQVFDVQLHHLHGWRNDDASWLCGPRRVGDGSALETDCVMPFSPGDGHA